MQLLSKFSKGIGFLLSIIDIYRKYVLVIHLKDKKDITITNDFQKVYLNQDASQEIYGWRKAANFKINSIRMVIIMV